MCFPCSVRLQDHSQVLTHPLQHTQISLCYHPRSLCYRNSPKCCIYNPFAVLWAFHTAQSRNEDLNHCNLFLWQKRIKYPNLHSLCMEVNCLVLVNNMTDNIYRDKNTAHNLIAQVIFPFCSFSDKAKHWSLLREKQRNLALDQSNWKVYQNQFSFCL